MYPRSYKEVIKKMDIINQQLREEKQANLHYKSYTVDLSSNELCQISNNIIYKKSFHKKHQYTISIDDTSITPISIDETKETSFPITFTPSTNYYSELLGTNGFLSAILDESVNAKTITDDFLTGYYLAKTYIDPQNVFKHRTESFHIGFANRSLVDGILAYIKTHGKSTALCEQYGTDLKVNPDYTDKYITGFSRNADYTNINVVRSIKNQFGEKLSDAQLSYYTCDVYPKTPQQLFSSLLIPLTSLEKTGTSMVRLPNLSALSDYTSIINILFLVISCFKLVHVFRTPWGIKPRYYLITSTYKNQKPLAQAIYTDIIAYISSGTNAQLFNQTIFTDNYENYSSIINMIRTFLTACVPPIDSITNHSEANDYFINKIMDKPVEE
jgi:hypothetical protein